jgi:hypothetical protein
MTYYPPRQAPATPNRKAGKCRSLRAACVASGYSIALTLAVLATANRRAMAGKPIVWPAA